MLVRQEKAPIEEEVEEVEVVPSDLMSFGGL